MTHNVLLTGTPAGRNRSRQSIGITKQSRSIVDSDTGSFLAAALSFPPKLTAKNQRTALKTLHVATTLYSISWRKISKHIYSCTQGNFIQFYVLTKKKKEKIYNNINNDKWKMHQTLSCCRWCDDFIPFLTTPF